MADYLPSPEEIRAEAARIREENARKAAAENRAPLESRAKPSKPYQSKATGGSSVPAPDHPWRADMDRSAKQALASKPTPAPDPTPEIAAERPSHPYRGITYKPKKRRWTAQTKSPGPGTKVAWIGEYRTPEAAARGYDAYVVKHALGKPLNFPAEHPGYAPAPEGSYRQRKPQPAPEPVVISPQAEQYVARLVEAERPTSRPEAPAVEDVPIPVASPSPPPKPDPWAPVKAHVDAVSDLLAVLRRHPVEVGRAALKVLMEAADR